jgi:hypothetical protein
MGRAYTDIDFAGYRKQARAVNEMMTALEYTEDKAVYMMSEGDRSIFHQKKGSLYGDRSST